MKTALVLVAKVPEPGRTKTRFCPPCTPEEAAEFARAFLLDTVSLVNGGEFDDCDAWCAHLGSASEMRSVIGDDLSLLEQRGGDLDDRLANAADDLFAMCYDRVVLIGADCPTVTSDHLRSALKLLDDNDVVLGPAEDGGYVFLAQRVQHAALYAGIKMSTDTVLQETVERAEEAGFTHRVLPPLHDLDTIEELDAAYEAGQLSHALQTLSVMRRLGFVSSP